MPAVQSAATFLSNTEGSGCGFFIGVCKLDHDGHLEKVSGLGDGVTLEGSRLDALDWGF